MCLASSASRAQNGALIAASPVTPDEEAIDLLERVDPTIRSILQKIEVRSILYLSDGLEVRGYLAVPRGGEGCPCVIYNRGGNRDFGALHDAGAALTLGRIARHGYVVAASQYRGAGGSQGLDEFGGADVNDVLNLIGVLESVPEADASRIGMYGWSRGGMMTYIALTRTDRIAAAIVAAAEVDLLDGLGRRPEMERVYEEVIPEYSRDGQAHLVARSAVHWPERLHKRTPVLLLHGSADWRVHPTQALKMGMALYGAKHPYRLVLFEGGDHALTEHRDEVDRLTRDWLDRFVRDRRAWPSLEPHGR
jgi:dipeptidyl aminopeptidase/acylaminoacyl peptidase